MALIAGIPMGDLEILNLQSVIFITNILAFLEGILT